MAWVNWSLKSAYFERKEKEISPVCFVNIKSAKMSPTQMISV